MDSNTVIIILSVVISAGVIYFAVRTKRPTDEQASQNVMAQIQEIRRELGEMDSHARKELQARLDRIDDQLDRKMQHSHSTMQEQFKQTSKIIEDVTTRLTTLDATNKQVLDFSSQLQNLQNILKNPKQRGVLGEYWLETLLRNVLATKDYAMQYHLGTDETTGKELIADAVIMIREQKIAIDAKFSLENYNRLMEESDAGRRDKLEKELKADIKNRIDETAKYIRQDLGTMNFAFMFIPAEGVYYNLLNAEVGSGINSQNLIDYAFKQHVMIVSPTSFYAYLQTVLLGLRELQLEQSTTEIIKRVGELGKHFAQYSDYHDRLGKNLGVVVNQFNLSSGELRKVNKDISKITAGTLEDFIEAEVVDKPLIE
jgi:DNA recombination protein RmuC